MNKFRKKPVVIEAVEYQPGLEIEGVEIYNDNRTDLPSWWDDGQGHRLPAREGVDAFIKTLEGTMHVSPGDWVIRGIKGELYPCKPDIFEATYEPVTEEPAGRSELEALAREIIDDCTSLDMDERTVVQIVEKLEDRVRQIRKITVEQAKTILETLGREDLLFSHHAVVYARPDAYPRLMELLAEAYAQS